VELARGVVGIDRVGVGVAVVAEAGAHQRGDAVDDLAKEGADLVVFRRSERPEARSRVGAGGLAHEAASAAALPVESPAQLELGSPAPAPASTRYGDGEVGVEPRLN
jgi:hypothetical protein